MVEPEGVQFLLARRTGCRVHILRIQCAAKPRQPAVAKTSIDHGWRPTFAAVVWRRFGKLGRLTVGRARPVGHFFSIAPVVVVAQSVCFLAAE